MNDLEKAVETCVKKFFNGFEQKYKSNDADFEFFKTIQSQVNDYYSYQHYYPFLIEWKIISDCNLRCKHCYLHSYDSEYHSADDLSTNQSLNLIEEFVEMNVVSVVLTGGEIFFRKDIFEILEKLKSKNISVTLLTNGTLLSKKIAQKLSKIFNPATDQIQISLDGATGETHEKTRGKGSFDKAIKGINNLIQYGIIPSVSFVATSFNVSELPQIYKLVKNMGIQKLSIVKFIACSNDQEKLIPNKKLLYKKIAETINLEEKTGQTILQWDILNFYDFINDSNAKRFISGYVNPCVEKSKIKSKNCMCHHHEKAYVESDGGVYLCSSTKNTQRCCLGNIKNESFINIWTKRHQHPLFQKRNSDLMVCNKCEYFKSCLGGCPLGAYQKYDDIHAPDGDCPYGESLVKQKSV